MASTESPKQSFLSSLFSKLKKPFEGMGTVSHTNPVGVPARIATTSSPMAASAIQGVAPLRPYSFDRDDFKKRIAHVESRGEYNPYKAIGITQDIGKYQVSPDTLKAWSGPWLDKEYTPEEYIQNPQAQEEFMEQYLDMVENYQLTPDEAAITWHRGWGKLGDQANKPRRRQIMEEQKKQYMADPDSLGYLTTFRNYGQQ
jgi:hypothetical protein